MSDSKRFSRSAMNKMEYGGANLVSIALPRFCLNVLSKNWKKLFFKTISANSTKVSVVTSLFSLLFKCFLIEARPSSCGILGYRPTTSVVHRIAFPGKLPNSLSFLRK